MLCLVCYLFIISTSTIDCLGKIVSEMTYYVSSGTLNLTKPKPGLYERLYFILLEELQILLASYSPISCQYHHCLRHTLLRINTQIN